MGLRRYADIYTCILLQANQGEGSTPGAYFAPGGGGYVYYPSKILSKFQKNIAPTEKVPI